MSDTTADTRLSPRPPSVRGVLDRARALTWARPELLALLALTAVLTLWALDRNGLANAYYAGAVRSMSESWHAFLYGSFDSSGVMTVDKPPLALWVQALSVRAFGFSSWAILVPEAIMGMVSVGLTYDLTRRRFGRAAGFAAGAVLALTPVAVAIFRHNNPDALLLLCSVAALWFTVRALEDGRTRWLVLAGISIGLGFETKLAAALLIVPALAAAWIWVAPGGRLRALGQAALAGAAMLAVGLAWPVLVWLTPAADRPWVGGTSDNSIWSLIVGYNGLGRLFGQAGGPAGGGGGGGGTFGGDPGALRLFNDALGGQAGWLLGFAAVAAVAVVWLTRLRRIDPRTGWIIAVAGSFLVIAVAFSRASGIFHPYYVSLLAPFTAALVGAGVGVVAGGGRSARVVGPAAVGAAVLTELMVLDSATDLSWWRPLLLVLGAAAAVALAFELSDEIRRTALVGAMAVLLLAPAVWSFETLGHATSGTFPAGGPESASAMGGPGGGGPGAGGPGGAGGGMPGVGGGQPPGAGPTTGTGSTATPPPWAGGTTGGTTQGPGGALGGGAAQGPGGMGGDQNVDEALAYIAERGGGTLAVSSQSSIGSAVAEDADVVAIGGFSGRESQVSIDWLAGRVASGQIRWVLVSGQSGGLPGDTRVGATDAMSAVADVCAPATSTSSDAPSGLYDCQGYASALQALAD